MTARGDGFEVSAADFYQVKEDTAVIRKQLETFGPQVVKHAERIAEIDATLREHMAQPGHPGGIERLSKIEGDVASLGKFAARVAGAVAVAVLVIELSSKFL